MRHGLIGRLGNRKRWKIVKVGSRFVGKINILRLEGNEESQEEIRLEGELMGRNRKMSSAHTDTTNKVKGDKERPDKEGDRGDQEVLNGIQNQMPF